MYLPDAKGTRVNAPLFTRIQVLGARAIRVVRRTALIPELHDAATHVNSVSGWDVVWDLAGKSMRSVLWDWEFAVVPQPPRVGS